MKEKTECPFGPEFESKVDAIVARYPVAKAAMLPVLWEVQRAKGWIDRASEEWVGSRLAVHLTASIRRGRSPPVKL